jgi:DNA-binding GntR family transcriptional regulator
LKLIDSVYEKLKEEVFMAKYKPNELIKERDIAEKYGVSKVTAGEVLHRLCGEGHLTSYPRSGYMVTTLTPLEMKQLKRMRIAVESLALEIICEEASDEEIDNLNSYIKNDFNEGDSATILNSKFHMAVANLTNDKFVISLMETLLGSASRVEQHVAAGRRAGWQKYHVDIIKKLNQRDADAAKRILVDDINQR